MTEKDIQILALDKFSLEKQARDLEHQLETSKLYLQLQNIKKKIEEADQKFREEAKDYMMKNNISKSEGPAGTISLCTRQTIKLDNIYDVPEEFKEFKLVPKMNLVEEQIKIFNKQVPGFSVKTTNYVSIRQPKTK